MINCFSVVKQWRHKQSRRSWKQNRLFVNSKSMRETWREFVFNHQSWVILSCRLVLAVFPRDIQNVEP